MRRRRRRALWDAVGVAVFVVMVFPVFWMISTAFKPNDEIVEATRAHFSTEPEFGSIDEFYSRRAEYLAGR